MPRNSFATIQRVRVSVAPIEEPVTLAEVKEQARIKQNAEDALITSWIKAARLAVEKLTTRKLVTQTLIATMDRFPAQGRNDWWDGVRQGTPFSTGITSIRSILLGQLPLQSVDKIETFDDANNATEFPAAEYLVDANDPDLHGRITLVEGAVWPSDLRPSSGIEITYIAGYGLAVDVPEDFKLAIKQTVAEWYKDREGCGKIGAGTKALLSQYIVMQV